MNTHDFTFGWEHAQSPEGPWTHLRVVSFEGKEALSELYRYEITLLAREPAPPVDPEELVLARATLAITTTTVPSMRYVHGVIVEAEEIGPTSAGTLYRVVLMPPLVRAAHRTRCRVFLEKTTRQIIDAVLLGDPQMEAAPDSGALAADESGLGGDFVKASERYTWRIQHPTRIDTLATRPYCVQYNESDLAFVCRLLEEEGISFHFENDASTCLLVLADADEGRAQLEPFLPLGPGKLGRHIDAMHLGKRLRASKVSLIDYNWKKPALAMGVSASSTGNGGDLFASSYPGLYPDAPGQGEPLAKSLLERLQTEARYAVGESSARILAAGSIFRLEHEASRAEGEYLVTALAVRGEATGELPPDARTLITGVPYVAKLECARRGKDDAIADSRFRPARVTPKPRILGSQTAFVTAEPSAKGAEIHVGGPAGAEIGCVRLRFHWDGETERQEKEPSSCWVRVSQLFAGAGEGALWHPRVGTEVVVEFLDGDPDRPLVTGRVYNGANRPPAGASGSPTVSTFKSTSSPGGATFNELSFDDDAGHEHVKLHAGKDYSTTVGHDRAEKIMNHSTSSVDVNRSESTGGNRTTKVVGNNTEIVSGDESLSVTCGRIVAIGINQATCIGADHTVSIGGHRSISVAKNESISVGANRRITVVGDLSETITGHATQEITSTRRVSVTGTSEETMSSDQTVTVGGTLTKSVTGAVSLSAAANKTDAVGANLAVTAGANMDMTAGASMKLIACSEVAILGTLIHVTASGEIVLGAGGSAIKISGAGVEISGAAVSISGGSVDVSGGLVRVN